MMRTARIFGEIEYNALQMDRGAALNCHILHNWAETDGLSEGPLAQRGSWFPRAIFFFMISGPSGKTDEKKKAAFR